MIATTDERKYAGDKLHWLVLRLVGKFLTGKVESTVEHTGQRVAIEIKPQPEDAGKMNGKSGAMFHAFNALLQQAAIRHGCHCHYSLQIPGKDDGCLHIKNGFKPDNNWQAARIDELLGDVCATLFDCPVDCRFINEPNKTRIHIRLAPEEPKRMPDIELERCVERCVPRHRGKQRATDVR